MPSLYKEYFLKYHAFSCYSMKKNLKLQISSEIQRFHKNLDCLKNTKSRLELLDATKRLLEEVSEKKKGLNLDDLDEEIVNESLYLSSTPQLLIRTSGEVRLSDFLLSKSYFVMKPRQYIFEWESYKIIFSAMFQR